MNVIIYNFSPNSAIFVGIVSTSTSCTISDSTITGTGYCAIIDPGPILFPTVFIDIQYQSSRRNIKT